METSWLVSELFGPWAAVLIVAIIYYSVWQFRAMIGDIF